MRQTIHVMVTVLLMGLMGCQTSVPKTTSQSESMVQSISALGTVTEGLTNQNISQEDLKKLAVSVKKDPQTASAVESINQALNAHQTGVKYCPVDGKRFDARVENCLVHQVKLRRVDE